MQCYVYSKLRILNFLWYLACWEKFSPHHRGDFQGLRKGSSASNRIWSSTPWKYPKVSFTPKYKPKVTDLFWITRYLAMSVSQLCNTLWDNFSIITLLFSLFVARKAFSHEHEANVWIHARYDYPPFFQKGNCFKVRPRLHPHLSAFVL